MPPPGRIGLNYLSLMRQVFALQQRNKNFVPMDVNIFCKGTHLHKGSQLASVFFFRSGETSKQP